MKQYKNRDSIEEGVRFVCLWVSKGVINSAMYIKEGNKYFLVKERKRNGSLEEVKTLDEEFLKKDHMYKFTIVTA